MMEKETIRERIQMREEAQDNVQNLKEGRTVRANNLI